MRGDETVMVHISIGGGGDLEKYQWKAFQKNDKIYIMTHIKVCSSTS